MRGARRVVLAVPHDLGIIPAYAGSTRAREACQKQLRDHPRVCGEHPDRHPMTPTKRGSSPRMRGALQEVTDFDDVGGIIPAYAGSTVLSYGREDGGWGSSPRMRGAHRGRHGLVGHRGIIPAYAGSTMRDQWGSNGFMDHPRVCGEHASVNPRSMIALGSSPRMRGARWQAHDGELEPGIIPAYAGSTS